VGWKSINFWIPRIKPEQKGHPQITIDLAFPQGANHNFEKGSIHVSINPAYWQESEAKKSPQVPLLLVMSFADGYGSILRFARNGNSDDLSAIASVVQSQKTGNTTLNQFEAPLPGSSDLNKAHQLVFDWGKDQGWNLNAVLWDNQPVQLPNPRVASGSKG